LLRLKTKVVLKTTKSLIGVLTIVAAFELQVYAQPTLFFDDSNISIGPGVYGAFSDPKVQLTGASFSTANSQYYLTGINWWGFYEQPLNTFVTDTPASPDNFTLSIFDYNGDAPGTIANLTLLAGSSADRQLYLPATINEPAVFAYTLNIQPFLLNPNSTYFFSLVNDAGQDVYWCWCLGFGPDPSTYFQRPSDSAAWAAAGGVGPINVLGFSLTGVPLTGVWVPEPATLALAGLGGAALLAMIRRRK